jgi:Flp pilus assembly protein TadD
LEGIRSEWQQHPDVLEVRWLVLARLEAWDQALTAARQLVQGAPQRASGWLHQAYSLRRIPSGGLQAAWEALLPAWEKFPKEAIVAYNLACYACQMQELVSARRWLKRALKAGNRKHIRALALRDRDLEALWPEIRKLAGKEE